MQITVNFMPIRVGKKEETSAPEVRENRHLYLLVGISLVHIIFENNLAIFITCPVSVLVNSLCRSVVAVGTHPPKIKAPLKYKHTFVD